MYVLLLWTFVSVDYWAWFETFVWLSYLSFCCYCIPQIERKTIQTYLIWACDHKDHNLWESFGPKGNPQFEHLAVLPNTAWIELFVSELYKLSTSTRVMIMLLTIIVLSLPFLLSTLQSRQFYLQRCCSTLRRKQKS